MIDGVFDRSVIAESHLDLFRNIISLRVSEDLFDDLSDDSEDWGSAIKLETDAKPHDFDSTVPVIHRPFEEAKWNDAVGFPFTNWMKSRYSDGRFGVWYGSDELKTTIHETVHHWRLGLLHDAGFVGAGIKSERKVYLVRCDAALIDLRRATKKFPALIDPNDWALTHQIGGRLHHEGHPGLVSISARCDGSTYAVLNPNVLSNPRQHCFLTYVTTTAGIAIERKPGAAFMRIP